MEYKITSIEGDTLIIEDHVNRDEWGNPTVMSFQLTDAECFHVGQEVTIMIVGKR